MIRTYKRKLILTEKQEHRLNSWIGVCRFVYNMGLQIKREAWKNKQQSINKYELMRQLTEIKDIDWIADVPSQSLQNVIIRLENAYKTFFRTSKKGGGFPKFSSKKRYKSIVFRYIKVYDNSISIPKIGLLKIFSDTEISGKPQTVTIIKDVKGYFACIQCKDVPNKIYSENQTIGLDMGIVNFYTDSNGNFIANPKHFKKYERRLRIENRSLSRKKKGSNRWKKQAKKISLLNHKIGNVRKDFLHKESTRIAKLNSLVCIEDLNIQGMVQNRSLAKHILDCGWGMFRDMLAYKTTVIRVDPKYTSQTCNECGQKDAKNRISQSEFCCTTCGHISNADINAAKNILSKGIALNRKRDLKKCA